MLDDTATAEYKALKEQYPNTLIGFELGGYFLFYDEDANTVSQILKNRILPQENALGKVQVSGFLRGQWGAEAEKLWAEGNNVYLAGLNEDGTHYQTKYLHEEQQEEISDAAHETTPDYKVGDHVVVPLPTQTIEGTIGYVGETDVRIDPDNGYSWEHEVLNKEQFEDTLRQDERNAELFVEAAPEAAGNFKINFGELADVKGVVQLAEVKMVFILMLNSCGETSAIRVVDLDNTAVWDTV